MGKLKLALKGMFVSVFITVCSSATAVAAPAVTDTEKAMVFLMLSQTSEVKIHQMRGATDNKVFLHKDGHKEAVYDGNGDLVKDGINDASYNYAHPVKDPFNHYADDIHPWIQMGASRKDPTSKKERILAYIKDLERGIVEAQKLWPETQSEKLLQMQAAEKLPKPWIEVLGQPGTQQLFSLIDGSVEITDENLISTLNALNDAFNRAY